MTIQNLLHRYLNNPALPVMTAALTLALGAAGAHATAIPPALTWSLATYDFGQVAVGQTPSQIFTLSNTGGQSSGTIMVTESGSSAFFIAADSCSDRALGPNKSCSVTIEYQPTGTAGDTGTLAAVAEHGNASMTLNGNGSPNLVLSPGTLGEGYNGTKAYIYDFGLVSSGTQTFTVSNTGTRTSEVLAISGSTSLQFTLKNDTCSNASLAPNGTCTFDLEYTPPAGCSPGVYGTEVGILGTSPTVVEYILLGAEGYCP